MEAGYAATVLGWPVYLLWWLFFALGFFGVVIETVYCLVREGLVESRFGLLYLPLRPMYGLGGVASTVLLDRFLHQPILVFLGGMLICTAVEYVAGSICDKLFGTLSWDYGGKTLHLHGKICLQYSCYWGLLVGLTVYVLTPVTSSWVSRIDRATGENVLTTLIALVLASALLTVAAWARTRHRLDAALRGQADGQVVIVRRAGAGRIVDLLAPDLLMINTFPRTKLARELMAVTGRQRCSIRPFRRRSVPHAPLGDDGLQRSCFEGSDGLVTARRR